MIPEISYHGKNRFRIGSTDRFCNLQVAEREAVPVNDLLYLEQQIG